MDDARDEWLDLVSELLRQDEHAEVEPGKLLDQVEVLLLGGNRRHSRNDLASATGMSAHRVRTFLQATGMPHVPDDEKVFTDGDLETLETAQQLIGDEWLDGGLETTAARALARSLRNLAEWQVHLLYRFAAYRSARSSTPESILTELEQFLALLARLQEQVWRRHLAATAQRMLARSPEQMTRTRMVVGFADLVNFSALATTISEGGFAELIDRFELTAAEVVESGGGRIVKSLGDEVLFVTDDETSAAEIGLGLLETAHVDPLLPALRIGMARGPVMSRYGDVYGATVNLASRLTTKAQPDDALVDSELANALADKSTYRLVGHEPQAVKGFPSLHAWSLSRNPDDDRAP